MPIKVTVWNEYRHERSKPRIAELYPDGIHNYIKSFIESEDVVVTTATLDEPEHGRTDLVGTYGA